MGAYDNNTSNNNTNKGKNNNKGKGKQLDVVQTSPLSEADSTVSCPSQTPSATQAFWCTSDVQQKGLDHDTGRSDNHFLLSSTRRRSGAEYLLLDSGAQLHACPIKHPGQRGRLFDRGILEARWVRFKLPEGRTVRVLFHACHVRKTHYLFWLSRSTGVLE